MNTVELMNDAMMSAVTPNGSISNTHFVGHSQENFYLFADSLELLVFVKFEYFNIVSFSKNLASNMELSDDGNALIFNVSRVIYDQVTFLEIAPKFAQGAVEVHYNPLSEWSESQFICVEANTCKMDIFSKVEETITFSITAPLDLSGFRELSFFPETPKPNLVLNVQLYQGFSNNDVQKVTFNAEQDIVASISETHTDVLWEFGNSRITAQFMFAVFSGQSNVTQVVQWSQGLRKSHL
jgi:hypothetical protein